MLYKCVYLYIFLGLFVKGSSSSSSSHRLYVPSCCWCRLFGSWLHLCDTSIPEVVIIPLPSPPRAIGIADLDVDDDDDDDDLVDLDANHDGFE